jgi:hypothetical protein
VLSGFYYSDGGILWNLLSRIANQKQPRRQVCLVLYQIPQRKKNVLHRTRNIPILKCAWIFYYRKTTLKRWWHKPFQSCSAVLCTCLWFKPYFWSPAGDSDSAGQVETQPSGCLTSTVNCSEVTLYGECKIQ